MAQRGRIIFYGKERLNRAQLYFPPLEISSGECFKPDIAAPLRLASKRWFRVLFQIAKSLMFDGGYMARSTHWFPFLLSSMEAGLNQSRLLSGLNGENVLAVA